MLPDINRYFICNILHIYEEVIQISGISTLPLYNDDKFSILNNKLSNLSVNLLHIFEQNQFQNILNITQRNLLNSDKNSPYHRVFSFAIKSKHGTVENKNYSDLNFNLPLCVYVFEDELTYDYFYQPYISLNQKEHPFLRDLYLTIIKIMELIQITNITVPKIYTPCKKYEIENNTINIFVMDQYRYYDYGIANQLNLHILKVNGKQFIPYEPQQLVNLQLRSPTK